jgi:hypothetical protein
MLRHRRKSLPLLVLTLAAALFLTAAAPSFANACAWEACWHCSQDNWGDTYCDSLTTGDGRLCCEEYSYGNGLIECRAFDYYCAGAVVWDVY